MNTKRINFLKLIQKYIMFGVLLLLVVFFSIANPYFFTLNNFLNVARQVAVLGVVGLGIAFVMLAGSFDLSSGSQMTVIAVTSAKLMNDYNVPVLTTIIISLLLGTTVGAVIGLLIDKLKISPFIGTLAISTSLGGIAFLLTNGATIQGFPDNFKVIGQGYLFGVPIPIILMIILLIIGSFVLNKTTFGRQVYAVGGNEETARLSGVKTSRIRIITFAISGLLMAVAGMMQMSRMNSVNATLGSSYTFDAITANMLGGVSSKGGVGKISGILIGILIIGVLSNGMTLMNIQSYWQNVLKGFIMFIAIAIDSIIDRASQKA